MQVLVVGGTGMAGAEVVAELKLRHEGVRVLSRGNRPAPAGVTMVRGDVRTGDGLDEALDGVDAVVNAVSSGTLRRHASERVQVEGTRNLLAAAARAGTAHYLALSIVGIDKMPGGYYAAKRQEEQLVMESKVPWSLLRATQFYELLDQLFSQSARLPVMPLPTKVIVQPVEAVHAGVRLADLVETGPSGVVPELGGPEPRPLGQFAAEWLRAKGRRRMVLPVPIPGRAGKSLRAGGLCPEHRGPGPSFTEWLNGHTARIVTG